jgi:hypothetical protein
VLHTKGEKSVFAVAVLLPQYISMFLCVNRVREPFPTVVGALFVLALVKPRAGAKTLHCLTAGSVNPPCCRRRDVSALALSFRSSGSQASPRGGAESDFEAQAVLIYTKDIAP